LPFHFLLFPESQILLEQLNDAFGVTKVLLVQLVDLVQGRLERPICDFAGTSVVLEDLVVENGEVQREAQLDRIAGGKVDLVCLLITLESLLLGLIELVPGGVLTDVAIIVANHLHEEGFGVIILTATSLKHLGLNHCDDPFTVLSQSRLNSSLVGFQSVRVALVLGVLLNCANCATGRPLTRNEILEGH